MMVMEAAQTGEIQELVEEEEEDTKVVVVVDTKVVVMVDTSQEVAVPDTNQEVAITPPTTTEIMVVVVQLGETKQEGVTTTVLEIMVVHPMETETTTTVLEKMTLLQGNLGVGEPILEEEEEACRTHMEANLTSDLKLLVHQEEMLQLSEVQEELR
jgi:hypothetical protein